MFLTVIFLIHPWLGVLALCSTVTLLGLGMLTETRSRGPYRTAGEQAVQVGTLGLGAWLVLAQEITPGMMIAAPIEQGIAAWRGCVTSRTAWDRLNTLI